jgi:hypothetical protein
VVEVVLPSLAAELARVALPAMVALVALVGSLWLFGRSRAAAALAFLGAVLVLGALSVDVVAFPFLNWLLITGALEPGPLPFRVTRAITNLGEGLGLVLLVLGAVVGPAPQEEE